jgi:hypothetical protein
MCFIHCSDLLVSIGSPIQGRVAKSSIGLSLLGHEGLNDIDPVYCMPAALIEKKGLKKEWAALSRRKE